MKTANDRLSTHIKRIGRTMRDDDPFKVMVLEKLFNETFQTLDISDEEWKDWRPNYHNLRTLLTEYSRRRIRATRPQRKKTVSK